MSTVYSNDQSTEHPNVSSGAPERMEYVGVQRTEAQVAEVLAVPRQRRNEGLVGELCERKRTLHGC